MDKPDVNEVGKYNPSAGGTAHGNVREPHSPRGGGRQLGPVLCLPQLLDKALGAYSALSFGYLLCETGTLGLPFRIVKRINLIATCKALRTGPNIE